MYKLHLSPQYEHLRSFFLTLDEQFSFVGTTIYKSRNEIKVIPAPDGLLLNVKRFKVPNVVNRVVYASLRQPKALRAYRNAQRLLTMGIDTPDPIGYLLYYHPLFGTLEHSYLVTMQLPDRQDMYQFDEKPLNGREEIVTAFARYTARLHQLGIYHKDYSPGNILFHQAPQDQEWHFSLVDLNRMRFGHVTLRQGCQAFARMWGGEEFLELVAREYAQAQAADPAVVRAWVLDYHRRFWASR